LPPNNKRKPINKAAGKPNYSKCTAVVDDDDDDVADESHARRQRDENKLYAS